MKEHCPQIAATFPARSQAEHALHALLERGVPPDTVQLIEPQAPIPRSTRRVLRQLALGAVGGAATRAVLAALAQLALLAAFPALLELGAWLSLPAALAFGAGLGAIAGGAIGAGRGAESRLAALLHRAFETPQRFTLIAQPRNLRETLLARRVFRESLI